MKSSLVTYTNLSTKHSGKRKYPITRITPHCIVGQWTAQFGCDYFARTDRGCSVNYIVGTDGSVGLCVEEENRAWTSSSSDNDNRAITIECASDKTEPYAFNDTCYNKLVELCVDICKRYNKTKLIWINDKDKALSYNVKDDELLLTVHRWFANTACPGTWMYNKMGELANDVTSALSKTTKPEDEYATYYCVQIGAFKKRENADKQLKRAKEAGFYDAYITTKVIK